MSTRRFSAANSDQSGKRNHVSRRGRTRSDDTSCRFAEQLERRTMLCGLHLDVPMKPVIEERPDLVGVDRSTLNLGFEPANIVWTNRGAASDGFAARSARPRPWRAVVDAVIVSYER